MVDLKSVLRSIRTCSTQYNTWKNTAINAKTREDMKIYFNKAFFWLELWNSLLVIWIIENTMGNNPQIKKKIEKALFNINKKITEYASQVLNEIKNEKYVK